MKLTSLTFVSLLIGFVLVGVPAQAGVDIDLGASFRGGDADVYLSISSRYFDRERGTVHRFAAHLADPDDLAVLFYLSKRSGRSCDQIYGLRLQGLSWWRISTRLGLPVDVWFVEVRHDPGPPYGKAYGHWKKHKRDRHHPVVFSDADLRDLTAVRMIHEYYGVSVQVAMDWRASGNSLETIMTGEYHKRHGKPAHAGHQGHGKGKGHKKKK